MLEKVIQAQILTYLSILRNKDLIRFYRIQNGPTIFGGGNAPKRFAKNPSPGISDIVIIPKGQFAIWAEIKTTKGRLSLDQVIFQEACKTMGHPYTVWTSLDDAIEYMTQNVEGCSIYNEKTSSRL